MELISGGMSETVAPNNLHGYVKIKKRGGETWYVKRESEASRQ